MMQRPSRPIGIAILAVLDIVVGVILLLAGLGLAAAGSSSMLATYGYGSLSGLVTILGGFFLLVGLLAVLVGWGFWTGKGWAWTLAVVLYVLGLLLSLLSLVSGIIPSIVSVLIEGLILWYLWRPNVRAYFRKGVPPPPSNPVSQVQT
jgi:hypothetical protein